MSNSACNLYGKLLVTAARLRLIDVGREIANKDGFLDGFYLKGLLVKGVACVHLGDKLPNGSRPVFKITSAVLTPEENEQMEQFLEEDKE